jgi:hypothetical protein
VVIADMSSVTPGIADGVESGVMQLRQGFIMQVAAASAISYFDRQTLRVEISAIQRNISILS